LKLIKAKGKASGGTGGLGSQTDGKKVGGPTVLGRKEKKSGKARQDRRVKDVTHERKYKT